MYPQNALMGMNIGGASVAGFNGEIARDTAANRLNQISVNLAECEGILMGVLAKYHGPTPQVEGPRGENKPGGINSQIMEINAIAQRIREALVQFDRELA